MIALMQIQIIENESRSAAENMEFDRGLLEDCRAGDEPVLHLYEWARPSVTYGYFIKPERFMDLDELRRHGVEAARRPTGGGIIFHIWDVAFGLVIPEGHPWYHQATLDNYEVVNSVVREAVRELMGNEGPGLLPTDPTSANLSVSKFCMAKPTIYDVMLGGRKIAGAAQRKKANGYLHQGTISIENPDEALLSDVLLDGAVLEAMRANTFSLNTTKEKMASSLKIQMQKALSMLS